MKPECGPGCISPWSHRRPCQRHMGALSMMYEFSERVWQELSGVLEAYLGKVREKCCGLWRPAALICQSKWLAEMFNHTLSAIKKKMNTFIETWPYQVKRTTYEWRLLVTTSNIWNTVIETWLNQVRKKYICVIIFCAHNIVD